MQMDVDVDTENTAVMSCWRLNEHCAETHADISSTDHDSGFIVMNRVTSQGQKHTAVTDPVGFTAVSGLQLILKSHHMRLTAAVTSHASPGEQQRFCSSVCMCACYVCVGVSVMSVYSGADEQPSDDFKVNRNKTLDE